MRFNHNRDLDSFSEELELLKKHGYKPIAVSQLMMEDTFVFETEEEATKAYEQFEVKPKEDEAIIGWWHGRESFAKAVECYETQMNEIHKENPLQVLVHWLNP